MSGLEESSQFSGISNEAYVGGTVSVGTTQVEARVGASRLFDRELLIIMNQGAQTIYFGPYGVTAATGIPIYKNQTVMLPAGDQIGVFLISASGTNTASVQEMA